MGKRDKLHRKKVQKRNESLKLQQKKLMADLQAQFSAQMAERSKAVKSTIPQKQVYASTGDFVAQNYDTIFQNGGQDAAQKLIESSEDGPKFR